MPAGTLYIYALGALVIALNLALLGFGGIAGAAASAAQIAIFFLGVLLLNMVGQTAREAIRTSGG